MQTLNTLTPPPSYAERLRGGPTGVRDAQRKILEVRGGAVGIYDSAQAPPEFLVLLLEAGRFATYGGLRR